MKNLFSPLKIRGVEFKNRIVVSPMCQYSSEDGFANDWHLVHLGTRAVGGAGLVFTEATAVFSEGRISLSDLGIWKDAHIPFLKRISTFIESQGAVAGMQLAHAGRKASQSPPWKGACSLGLAEGGWVPLAPSPLSFKAADLKPKALTIDEIHKITEAFVNAAKRAHDAGFKVLELHAAHGYLLNEFLSPLSNIRTDLYGGSFENRIRFLLELVHKVRKVWPEHYPLFVRISATEWKTEGWAITDSFALATRLQEAGVDLIDCSSGGNIPDVKIPLVPLYQVPLAAAIKKETGILTGAVGLITTAAEADEIVKTEQADLVFMAREMLRNPYFPLHAAKTLHTDVKWPDQYERAKPK